MIVPPFKGKVITGLIVANILLIYLVKYSLRCVEGSRASINAVLASASLLRNSRNIGTYKLFKLDHVSFLFVNRCGNIRDKKVLIICFVALSFAYSNVNNYKETSYALVLFVITA